MDFDTNTSAVLRVQRTARYRGAMLMTFGLILLGGAAGIAHGLDFDTRRTIALCLIPGIMMLWALVRILMKQVIRANGVFGRGSELMQGSCRLDLDSRSWQLRGLQSDDAAKLVVGRGDAAVDVAIIKTNGLYVPAAIRVSQADAGSVWKPVFTVARDPKSLNDYLLLVAEGRCHGIGGKVKQLQEGLEFLQGIVEASFPGKHVGRRLLLYPETADGFANAAMFGLAGVAASAAINSWKRDAAANEAAEGKLREAMDASGWKLEAGQ